MKSIYKATLVLGAMAAAMTAGAQNTVEWKFDDYKDFNMAQYTTAAIADFTNNDLFDLYYGGYRYDSENFGDPGLWPWMSFSNLYLNQGNGEWIFKGIEKEATGEQEEKDGVMVDKYRELFSSNGIHPSLRNHFATFDYNNDGLVDLLTYGYLDSNTFLVNYRDDYGYVQFHDIREGHDDYANYYYKILLYKNNGDGTFSRVENFDIPACMIDGNSDHGERTFNNMFAVGDYDRDGYVDIALAGKAAVREDGKIFRRCELWRNIDGSGVFEKQLIAESKATPVAPNDSSIEFPGEFMPISGNVVFGDLNNDGWLDLVFTGYASEKIDPNYPDTNCYARVYINQNGEKFVDVTSPDFVPQRSAGLALADFDGDGYLDLVNPGYGNGWLPLMWYNDGEGSDEIFTQWEQIQGLEYKENFRPWARDVNGDGLLDILFDGEDNDMVYYQDVDGSYYPQFQNDDWNTVPVRGRGSDDGGQALGDLNGDGLIDRYLSGYYWMEGPWYQERNRCEEGGGWTYASIYYMNCGDASNIVAPSAPTNVQAVIEDGMLNITWTDLEDDATVAYNIFVQSEDELYCLIPANPINGFVKVSDGKHVLVRPGVQSYSIPAWSDEYLVGVQAVSLYNETYSPFATTMISGLSTAKKDVQFQTKVNGNTLMVNADHAANVEVYNTMGQLVATGVTNQGINLAQNGVFVVVVDGRSVKISK